MNKEQPMSMAVTTLSVGSVIPWAVPLYKDAKSLTLRLIGPTFELMLNKPYDLEKEFIEAKVVAITFFEDKEYPYGLLGILFEKDDSNQFYVHAPMVCEPEEIDTWRNADNNMTTILLIDSENGTLVTSRIIGIGKDILEHIKNRWSSLNQDGNIINSYNELTLQVSDTDLFSRSKKWIYDKEDDCFFEVM